MKVDSMLVETIVRLLLAVVIGALIGMEREISNQPAGFRTHILVAIGAAVVTMVGYYSVYNYQGIANIDPNRLAAQVINGVGFLGAGTIMKEGVTVRGVTTAAGIWSVACLGIAAGAGYYILAFIGLSTNLLVLLFYKVLRNRIRSGIYPKYRIELECKNTTKILQGIRNHIKTSDGIIQNIKAKETNNEMISLSLSIQFLHTSRVIKPEQIFETIANIKGINNLKIVKY